MDLVQIIKQGGHEIFQKTPGEYAGPCPFCGGTDRFIVWPDRGASGSYWCRQCGKKGGPVQYLVDSGKGFIEAYIDYWTMCGNSQQQTCVSLKDKGYVGAVIKHMIEKQGMTYKEACEYIDVDPEKIDTIKKPTIKCKPYTKPAFKPRETKPPADRWREKAEVFLNQAHKCLMTDSGAEARRFLHDRGLSGRTVKMACLGWNLKDVYRAREAWGLPSVRSEKTGKPKKLWLPKGLVIPYQANGQVVRLRIRRPGSDHLGRYIIISGGATRPLILPCKDRVKGMTWVILESELDALLVYQEAGDLVGVIGLGSAQIRPDVETHKNLAEAEIILLALDSDEAGVRESWRFWAKTYRQFKRWPCIEGKDPGEMHQAGVNVRLWIKAGLKE